MLTRRSLHSNLPPPPLQRKHPLKIARLSDRIESPLLGAEYSAPSTAVEKDAHPTVSSLEPPATSLTTQTPTEDSETLSIIPEKELPSAPIIEEKEDAAGKEHLTDNGNQHSIVEEKVDQDTEEKGILSTTPAPFPPES